MTAVSKGLKHLFSTSIKASRNLLAGGNGAPGLVERFAQLQHGGARRGLVAMHEDHGVTEVALVKGAR